MMLTQTNPDGTWNCKGIDFKEVSGDVYGALCKLRDYEKSGFEPDDLSRIQENIHIGSVLHNYTVFGIWNDYCIAENLNAPAPYVTWKIDRDGFGVRAGSYFDKKEDAEKNFFKRAFGSESDKKEYWKR